MRRRKAELECREAVGFSDQKLYDGAQLKVDPRLGGLHRRHPLWRHLRHQSAAGLQGIKDILIDDGMQIFESTAMERLEDHTVYTHAGSVTAEHIIIAVDKLEESISPLAAEVLPRPDLPQRHRAAHRRRAEDPVPVGRADAVLGFEAGLHLFPPDRATTGCCSAAARRSPRS